MTRSRWWTGALALVMAAGCGDDADGSGGGGGGSTSESTTSTATVGEAASSGAGEGGGEGGGGGTATVTLDIVWEPCPLYSNGDDGPDVECATIAVPSRWDDPSSEKIDFFVKRVPARVQPARAQVWYLEGGPGVAGDSFDTLAPFIAGRTDDVDQYLPDHRGTGRSSRLGCSAEDEDTIAGAGIWETEWTSCLADLKEEWGDLVTAFTITNAARDLGEAIAATRAEGQQVIVFGGSYGSSWANRYLTLYPDQPTAVGMSALFVNVTIDQADTWFDELGERWMGLCGEDELCASYLGDDPWETTNETFDALDDGWCSELTSKGLDRSLFQRLFSGFFYAWTERALIAAMVHRLQRCNEADIAAFNHLLEVISAEPEAKPNSNYMSTVLNGLISTSELWTEPPPPASSYVDQLARANVAQRLMAQYAEHFDEWPRYEPDPYKDVFGPPTEHMLLIGGELDFIKAESREPALANYEGPNRPFILMPRAGHTLGQSPYASGRPSCGVELLAQFIADPEGEIDTTCADQVLPIDFDIRISLARGWFGVPDAWGDDGELEKEVVAPRPLTGDMARTFAPIRAALLARGAAPSR